MRCLFYLLLLYVVSCKSNTSNNTLLPRESHVATTITANNSHEINDIVPLNVAGYLSKNMKDWRIVDTADYGETYWSFYDKSYIPYIVCTDINDDRVADYGILLKKKDTVAVVMLLGKADNGFERRVADKLILTREKQMYWGLSIVPPAQIDVVNPEEKSLLLTGNAIALSDYEIKDRLYYWQKGAGKIFYMQ